MNAFLTLLESMASMVPSISTDVGDARRIIGPTGWIVEPSNPYAIAECTAANKLICF